MEKFHGIEYKAAAVLAAAGLALTACSNDGYLTDESNVHCDGQRTVQDLEDGGKANFIVHGEDGLAAEVVVKREGEKVALATSDIRDDKPLKFGSYVEIANGYELDTVAADGVWLLDAFDDKVFIVGSCKSILTN